jgi:hypothetical protein
MRKLLQLRSLLPPATVISIVDDAVKDICKQSERDSGAPIVLIDGFPRCPESAPPARLEWGDLSTVLFFDCPRALAEVRFLGQGDRRMMAWKSFGAGTMSLRG